MLAGLDQREQELLCGGLQVGQVVDEHDPSGPPGVPGRMVLLTNLGNKVQPLLR